MRRVFIMQKGVVLLLVLAILVSSALALAPPEQTSAPAPPKTKLQQTADAASLAQRIERVENGLLPPAVVKGETPARMKLADRMRFYKTPGVSIALINEGRIEWARGYGVLEAGGKEPVTPETLFQAASISKSLSAMLALRLVEQGKLGLDSDVNERLVSWKVPESEFTKEQKVTLRRLLAHTAGVTVPGFLGYPVNQAVPALRQILEGEEPANSAPIRVDTTPGSKFRYAGGGYVILQQLMMDVTGLSFPDLMQKTVLQKLGMTNSTFQQPLSPDLASRAAAGHLPDGKEIKGKWFVLPELAPAGLWTTPTDLARFVIEVQKSRLGKSNKVLSTASIKQMLTPEIDNVALGWLVDGQGSSARLSFSGANVGYKCRMLGYMNSGQGVVVMTNSENGAELTTEILRSVAAEYGWPDFHPRERVVVKVDPGIYGSYVGEYEIAPGFILVVTREGDKLMSQATPVPLPPSAAGQPKSEMFPESETTFFVKDADAQFTFVKNDRGQVIQVNIQRTTRMFPARKIK
ncbi:MAG TPA: serine hydrolase [Pyrinomonadaceae bacterium]|nr:serine hydrolase [Pyrinomonadaceae bacterium]